MKSPSGEIEPSIAEQDKMEGEDRSSGVGSGLGDSDSNRESVHSEVALYSY